MLAEKLHRQIVECVPSCLPTSVWAETWSRRALRRDVDGGSLRLCSVKFTLFWALRLNYESSVRWDQFGLHASS